MLECALECKFSSEVLSEFSLSHNSTVWERPFSWSVSYKLVLQRFTYLIKLHSEMIIIKFTVAS